MLTKYLLAGVAGSMLLASSAFAAEETTTKTPAPATTAAASNTSFHGDWRASKVVGLNVYNEKNENVGSINDLLMDKEGNVKAAVISVGGFLGMGSRLIALPLDKVKFSETPVPLPRPRSAATCRPAPTRRPASTTTGSTAKATSKTNPWYPDHAMINGSKDELKNMPEFKFDRVSLQPSCIDHDRTRPGQPGRVLFCIPFRAGRRARGEGRCVRLETGWGFLNGRK